MYYRADTNGATSQSGDTPAPGVQTPQQLIGRRHEEWKEFHLHWRWLMDSYEGGPRYSQAIYGLDRRGYPVRNLIRHKREYPDPRWVDTTFRGYINFPATNPLIGLGLGGASDLNIFPGTLGSDPASLATDDQYEYRRARTPVPEFVSNAIDLHLARLYKREVTREVVGPDGEETDDAIKKAWDEWSKNVDGAGTSFDEYMKETIAPLLMTLGQLDVLFDHPAAPEGAAIATKADSDRYGLAGCVMSYILPENMLWWRLDARKQYAEVLCLELHPEPEGGIERQYRYWNDKETVVYGLRGVEKERRPHSFGRPPIRRLFDQRKFRCENCGHSRYVGIAGIQREYYNRDSELVLSDTIQAHPLLQMPEDFCEQDKEVATGPDYAVPKKKNINPDGSASYEGSEYISAPHEGAESLRQNKSDLREEADRLACLTKPAGASGTAKGTVAQSGVSKQIDQSTGNDRLTKMSTALARAERQIIEMWLLVLNDGPPRPEDIERFRILYPTEFDLFAPSDMAAVISQLQGIVGLAGDVPETEFLLISRLVRLILPGLSDETYEACDDEIQAFLEAQAAKRQQAAELRTAAAYAATGTEDLTPPGAQEEETGEKATPTPGTIATPDQQGRFDALTL